MGTINLTRLIDKKEVSTASGQFTNYTYEGSDGKKYQSPKELPLGEGEYEVTPNGNWPSRIKPVRKFGSFAPRPVNNRVPALQAAIQLCCAGAIKTDQILASAEKFSNWLDAK